MAIVETYPVDTFEVVDDGTTLFEECGAKKGELYETECPICKCRILGKIVVIPGKSWKIAEIQPNWYYDGSCQHFYPEHSFVVVHNQEPAWVMFNFGGDVQAENDPDLLNFLKSHEGSWAK